MRRSSSAAQLRESRSQSRFVGERPSGSVSRASDRPHRLLALGVPNTELRHYGEGAEHRAAHGLDAAGIRRAVTAWLS